ncbi:MAG: cytochrome c biogenesis protein CcdA [candidate division WOR-3 bacterium]
MIADIFNFVYKLLYSSFIFSIIGSFLWGILSLMLSPCHLSSIPLLIGYIIQSKKNTKINGLVISSIFSIGILISLILVGTLSLLLGRIAGDLGIFNNIIISLIFLLLTLYFFNILNFDFFNIKFDKIFKVKNLKVVSFLIGLLFGTGIGPCTFAFFAPIFIIVFKSSNNILKSLFILLSFGLGHIFFIILSGGFTELLSKYIDFASKNRTIQFFRKIIGITMLFLFLYYFARTVKGVIK